MNAAMVLSVLQVRKWSEEKNSSRSGKIQGIICCKTGSNVGGKTRNIAIQLVLQQCCKTSCTFFLPRVKKPLDPLIFFFCRSRCLRRLRYGKSGNKKRATSLATLLQNELNRDVRVLPPTSNLSCNKSG